MAALVVATIVSVFLRHKLKYWFPLSFWKGTYKKRARVDRTVNPPRFCSWVWMLFKTCVLLRFWVKFFEMEQKLLNNVKWHRMTQNNTKYHLNNQTALSKNSNIFNSGYECLKEAGTYSTFEIFRRNFMDLGF